MGGEGREWSKGDRERGEEGGLFKGCCTFEELTKRKHRMWLKLKVRG